MHPPGLKVFWPRIITLGLVVVLSLTAGFGIPTNQAWAYQEAEMAEEGTPAEAKPAEKTAAAPADAAATESSEPAPVVPQSYLMMLIEASGPFGACIFICSFVGVALVVMNLLELKRNNFVPTSFIETFEQHLNAKNYQAAYESARADDSLVARVLAAGMAKLSQGYDKAVEGMQEVGDDENMALEHRLSYLALISSISPMLGLLGTVQGMIASFRVIAVSVTAPKPAELAHGIMTALVTTLEGLCVAIPVMICYVFIRNRISRLMFEVGNVSEALMSRFSQAGKPVAK